MGAEEAAGLDPSVAMAIAGADRFLANVDRTRRNPNLLRRPDGTVAAIDYGACLFLSRALAGRAGPFEPRLDHLLASSHPVAVPPLDWRAILADLPDGWIAAAGADRPALLAALAAYEARARKALAGH